MPRGLCNAISVACQLHKKAAAAEIGHLGVWTNHVKISVVASENALQPNEPVTHTIHDDTTGPNSRDHAALSAMRDPGLQYCKRTLLLWQDVTVANRAFARAGGGGLAGVR